MPVAEPPGLARRLEPPEPLAFRPIPVRSTGFYGPVPAADGVSQEAAEYYQDCCSYALCHDAAHQTDWPDEIGFAVFDFATPPEEIYFAVEPWPGQPAVWFRATGRRLNDSKGAIASRHWGYDVKEIG